MMQLSGLPLVLDGFGINEKQLRCCYGSALQDHECTNLYKYRYDPIWASLNRFSVPEQV
jgi:trimethylamine:corrinoid methyltransferase-like protein